MTPDFWGGLVIGVVAGLGGILVLIGTVGSARQDGGSPPVDIVDDEGAK